MAKTTEKRTAKKNVSKSRPCVNCDLGNEKIRQYRRLTTEAMRIAKRAVRLKVSR